MDVRVLGDLLIYLGYLAGALASIGLVVRFAVVRPFRSFISREINAPLVDIRDQLSAAGDLAKRFDDHLVNHHGAVRHG